MVNLTDTLCRWYSIIERHIACLHGQFHVVRKRGHKWHCNIICLFRRCIDYTNYWSSCITQISFRKRELSVYHKEQNLINWHIFVGVNYFHCTRSMHMIHDSLCAFLWCVQGTVDTRWIVGYKQWPIIKAPTQVIHNVCIRITALISAQPRIVNVVHHTDGGMWWKRHFPLIVIFSASEWSKQL